MRENGCFRLQLRPQGWAEQDNAALSLATNLAVADALLKAHTGLFRTMPEPQEWAVRRLRHTAKALGVDWPKSESLQQLEQRLDPASTADAALMLAIRRASPGAAYEPYREGVRPWHSAVAATYAHATAPLRRLADRYVVEAALAVANGRPVAEPVAAAFEKLPDVMQKADAAVGPDCAGGDRPCRGGQPAGPRRRAVRGRGHRHRPARRSHPAVRAAGGRADQAANGLKPGDELTVRLDGADPLRAPAQLLSGGLASARPARSPRRSAASMSISLVSSSSASSAWASGAAARPLSRASRARMSISTSS